MIITALKVFKKKKKKKEFFPPMAFSFSSFTFTCAVLLLSPYEVKVSLFGFGQKNPNEQLS